MRPIAGSWVVVEVLTHEEATVRGEHRHALVCWYQPAVGEGRDSDQRREEHDIDALPRQHIVHATYANTSTKPSTMTMAM
jgi:predicted GTPase